MIATAQSGQPRRQFGVLDATAVIVGIVVGAGIYQTTPTIAASLPGPAWLLPVWLAGALVALLGALCYTEIATRLPRAGGDYAFLTVAYGPRAGFLFAWAEFWLMRPASIGALAFVFARYAHALVGYDGHLVPTAAAVVVLLTGVNVMGVRSGKMAQNLLAYLPMLGLLLLAIAGLLLAEPDLRTPEPLISGEADFALAMILVLYTYGGWNSIAYIAGEVRDPQRNILRALLLGIGLITLLYVLVNLAFLRVLGFEGMGAAEAIAADLAEVVLGGAAAASISLLICITCLGNINGMIITGSRIFYAAGRDHAGYRWLGQWHPGLDAPVLPLTLQMLITLVLIVVLGAGGQGFERLVVFSTPLFWVFFTMVALSLFLLRRRTDIPTGYRVPCYPFLPALFCLFAGSMFVVSLNYALGRMAPELSWVLMVMLIGLFLAWRQVRNH